MLDFLFYIFQAIGSFFIILLFFHKAIFLFIVSAFCWSLAIHNILLLNIKKKYKFFFVGLILAIIFGSGAYKQDYIFLVCAVIFTPIFLYLLRKKLHNFYIFKLQKSLIAFGLFGTMVCVWQLEVPQRLVFKIFTTLQPYPKYEIMPLEVKNDTNASFVDKVSSFRLKNMDKKLPCGLISFYCNIRSIYYSDENIKDFELVKIYGAYFARSTLFNALTIYDASAYEYYGNSDFNEIKKLINKQGEDNVAK